MSHDHLFLPSSVSQRKRTEVKYICIHTCIHFSNIRRVDALKTIKTTFERDLAEVKIKAVSQETRTPILSGPRAKKKVLCSDLQFETRIFFFPR